MDSKRLYLYALNVASGVVMQVEPDQFGLPTPDTEWSVHDLLQHIIYELAWTADIVMGRRIEEVGDKYDAGLLAGNPAQAWKHYEVLAKDAVESCDEQAVAHLSYADKTVSEYLFEAGNDQLIHAWDLGEAIGVPVVFDEAVAKQLYGLASGRKEELTGSGLFAAPVVAPKEASTQVKLLALLGRSENWVSYSR